jgi:hypothetical protein
MPKIIINQNAMLTNNYCIFYYTPLHLLHQFTQTSINKLIFYFYKVMIHAKNICNVCCMLEKKTFKACLLYKSVYKKIGLSYPSTAQPTGQSHF